VDKLKGELEELTNRRVNLNIVEVMRPDLDAQLAAEAVAEQLKRRASFRRAIKQRCEAIMQAGAKGAKIQVAGRIGGAEMSRTVKQIMGSIPLHTLDADVDYGFATSFTTYGALGVKVWIYRGMFGESVSPDEAGPAGQGGFRPERRPRRGGPGGPGGGRGHGGGRGPGGGRGGRRGRPEGGGAPGAGAPQPSGQQ